MTQFTYRLPFFKKVFDIDRSSLSRKNTETRGVNQFKQSQNKVWLFGGYSQVFFSWIIKIKIKLIHRWTNLSIIEVLNGDIDLNTFFYDKRQLICRHKGWGGSIPADLAVLSGEIVFSMHWARACNWSAMAPLGGGGRIELLLFRGREARIVDRCRRQFNLKLRANTCNIFFALIEPTDLDRTNLLKAIFPNESPHMSEWNAWTFWIRELRNIR